MPIEEVEGGYKPSGDEAFMNERQRDYFRRKLIAWKEEILRESQETLVVLQRESENHPDLADRASFETGRSIELRARIKPAVESDRYAANYFHTFAQVHGWISDSFSQRWRTCYFHAVFRAVVNERDERSMLHDTIKRHAGCRLSMTCASNHDVVNGLSTAVVHHE